MVGHKLVEIDRAALCANEKAGLAPSGKSLICFSHIFLKAIIFKICFFFSEKLLFLQRF
jgi:hypothetical protein